jgi:hypothetical protein
MSENTAQSMMNAKPRTRIFQKEVQGSINSALYDNQITAKEAETLRDKYLWGVVAVGKRN